MKFCLSIRYVAHLGRTDLNEAISIKYLKLKDELLKVKNIEDENIKRN